MIDRKARAELRESLRRLVAGELTNGEFDDLYYEKWQDSPDRGVAEIASFAYGLYSSDTLIPYAMKGRHSVRAEEREAAARCDLFLAGECEYEWPPFPRQLGRRLVWTLSYWGLAGGTSLLVVGLLGLFSGTRWHFDALLVLGILLTLASVWGFRSSREEGSEMREFWALGEREAWPFLRRDQLEVAH